MLKDCMLWFWQSLQACEHWYYCTNLTSNDLTMKIMWSSFVHRFIHFIYQLSCIKTMFHIWNVNIWMNKLDITLYVHVSNMFSMHNIYAWIAWTNKWMNLVQFSLNFWMISLWYKKIIDNYLILTKHYPTWEINEPPLHPMFF
jgi:hypothetical protein